jgi:hypothetical protein
MKTLKGNLISSSTILALFGTVGLCFFWKHTDGFDWWLLVGIVVLVLLISYR